MKVIAGSRRSGRTTELIREADDTGAIIVCAGQSLCQHVQSLASDMGMTVRTMTFDSFIAGRARGEEVGVLVDNIEFCLRQHTGTVVDTISCLAGEVRTFIRDPEFQEGLHA